MALGATFTLNSPHAPGKKIKPPPTISNVFLAFQGVGFTSGKTRQFQAMCGANPPTITAGYAKTTTLERPKQRGLTIFDGYDPVQMTVQIVFGSWVGTGWLTDDATGRSIKGDIDVLEWMGGSNFQAGPAPVIYVWCYSSSGAGQTDLIPPQYQSTPQAPFPWILTTGGLQWGTAYRNASGLRVWQEATLVLENYLNLGGTPPPDTSAKGGYFVTSPKINKPILIAGAKGVLSPMEDHAVLAGRICEDPKNNPCKATSIKLNRKGVYYAIRKDVSVWIPGHVIV
jgi:hypothetical protein